MRNYMMPGVTITRRRSYLTGAAVLAVTIAVITGTNDDNDRPDTSRMQVSLATDQVGAGIVAGTGVRVDGVEVGTVRAIAPIANGRQLITLDLDRTQTADLTEDLGLSYAPANLFGISTVVLDDNGTGKALESGARVDLTGDNAHKVTDVTLGTLMRQIAASTTAILTPQLTELITQVSTDIQLFTPMLEAMITLSRTVADNTVFPPSAVIGEYASFIRGIGDFGGASFVLLQALLDIDIFQTDRARFDATIRMMGDRAFPALTEVSTVSAVFSAPLADLNVPLLQAYAAMLPDPQTSRAQLDELLGRLDRAFPDAPNGPVMNLEVVLNHVPALAFPLLQWPLDGGDR